MSDAATSDKNKVSLTIRLVRSFEYRTFKNLFLRDVDVNLRVSELMERIQTTIATTSGMKIYVKNDFDTLKIFMFPHGAKTSNLIINLDHDHEWMMDPSKKLSDYNIVDETEISFFNRAQYEVYKQHPDVKW